MFDVCASRHFSAVHSSVAISVVEIMQGPTSMSKPLAQHVNKLAANLQLHKAGGSGG